jgi:hypothetical protein
MKPGNRQQHVEMVPIPTKLFALEDEREDTNVPLSVILQKGFFVS